MLLELSRSAGWKQVKLIELIEHVAAQKLAHVATAPDGTNLPAGACDVMRLLNRDCWFFQAIVGGGGRFR